MSELPDFDLALPGQWSLISLDDEASAARSIRRLVAAVGGRDDNQAALRADLRRRFTAVAERARAASAKQLYLCREIVPGVPLPSSLTVYWPPVALRSTSGPDGAAELRSVLGTPGAGEVESEFGVGERPGIRRHRIVTGPAGPESDSPEVTTVEVDYWLPLPQRHGVVLLSFACGMPLLRDQLVELFDLVVSTVRWRALTKAR